MTRIIQLFLIIGMTVGNLRGQSEVRNLESYFSVEVSGSISLELIHGDESKAEINMIRGEVDDVETKISGGTLKVKMKSKNKFGRNNAKAEIKLYYQDLEGISTSAGSYVFSMENINSRSMVIEASSGSKCKVSLSTEKLNADASSGANITIKGKGNDAEYEASSGSKIDAVDLENSKVNAEASSGASISLWTTKKLVADASSGGNISYKGEPKEIDTNRSISGGSIKRINK